MAWSGDALLVVFPIEEGAFPDVESAAFKATKCALALARNLHQWKALDDPTTGKAYTLSLHIGVGVGGGPECGGTLTALHCGGYQNRCEFVLAGERRHAPPRVLPRRRHGRRHGRLGAASLNTGAARARVPQALP